MIKENWRKIDIKIYNSLIKIYENRGLSKKIMKIVSSKKLMKIYQENDYKVFHMIKSPKNILYEIM